MSSVNNLEPQAFGHIVLKTTFGDLDVELFAKQCPKLCRNFVQLCLDGYYKDTIFNRVEKDFIAIGGIREDEAQDDELKGQLGRNRDEFHSRLRFTRRGLLATANIERDANGPDFFFTLGPTPELQNKHSIFGRLKGDSVYCLVDLNECQVDEDLRPLSEKKVLEVQILVNPFPELEPRNDVVANIQARLNPKSALTSQNITALDSGIKSNKKLSFHQDDSDEEDSEDEKSIPNDLKSSDTSEYLKEGPTSKSDFIVNDFDKRENDSSEPTTSADEKREEDEARKKRLQEVRAQFQNIKKQFECDSAIKIRTLSERRGLKRELLENDSNCSTELQESSSRSRLSDKKCRDRERETVQVVQIFKKKLKEMSKKSTTSDDRPALTSSDDAKKYDDDEARLAEELDLVDGDSWLEHKFEACDSVDDSSELSIDFDGGKWHPDDDRRNRVAQRNGAQHSSDYRKASPSSRYDKNNLDDKRRHYGRP